MVYLRCDVICEHERHVCNRERRIVNKLARNLQHLFLSSLTPTVVRAKVDGVDGACHLTGVVLSHERSVVFEALHTTVSAIGHADLKTGEILLQEQHDRLVSGMRNRKLGPTISCEDTSVMLCGIANMFSSGKLSPRNLKLSARPSDPHCSRRSPLDENFMMRPLQYLQPTTHACKA